MINGKRLMVNSPFTFCLSPFAFHPSPFTKIHSSDKIIPKKIVSLQLRDFKVNGYIQLDIRSPKEIINTEEDGTGETD